MSDYQPYHRVQGELFDAIRGGLVSWDDPPSEEFIYLKESDGRSWVKVLAGGNGLLKVIKYSSSGMRRAFYIKTEVLCQLVLGDSPLKIRMVSASLNPDGIWYEMPFHALGSLENVFMYFGGVFSEAMQEVFLLDLAASILFLHDKMVVHRDVKHENTIIRRNYRLALADMDLSCILKVIDLMNSRKGNLLFGHPFIGARPRTRDKGTKNLDGDYTPQMADIYSLGTMILWLLGFWDEEKLVQLKVATKLCKTYFTGQTYNGTVFQDQFLTLVWEAMDDEDMEFWTPEMQEGFRDKPLVRLALECMDCTHETSSIIEQLLAILDGITQEKMDSFTEDMQGYEEQRVSSHLIVWCNERRLGDYYIRLQKYFDDNARLFHKNEAELISYLSAGKLNPKMDNPLLREVMKALKDSKGNQHASTEPAELTMVEHNKMLRFVFEAALETQKKQPEEMKEVQMGPPETATTRQARKRYEAQLEEEAKAEATEVRKTNTDKKRKGDTAAPVAKKEKR